MHSQANKLMAWSQLSACVAYAECAKFRTVDEIETCSDGPLDASKSRHDANDWCRPVCGATAVQKPAESGILRADFAVACKMKCCAGPCTTHIMCASVANA